MIWCHEHVTEEACNEWYLYDCEEYDDDGYFWDCYDNEGWSWN